MLTRRAFSFAALFAPLLAFAKPFRKAPPPLTMAEAQRAIIGMRMMREQPDIGSRIYFINSCGVFEIDGHPMTYRQLSEANLVKGADGMFHIRSWE